MKLLIGVESLRREAAYQWGKKTLLLNFVYPKETAFHQYFLLHLNGDEAFFVFDDCHFALFQTN